MSCEWIRDNLFAFIDRELDPSQERIVEKHLHDCEACRHEYGKILNAWKSLDIWEDLIPPQHLQKAIRSSIIRRRETAWLNILVPAAAVLLIIAGIALFYRAADTRNTQKLTAEHKTTAVQVRNDILKENEDEIIANLQLLREKEFYDSLDKLETIDYLPLVEDQQNKDEKDRRGSLELFTT